MRGRYILPTGRNFRRVGPHQLVKPTNLPPGMQNVTARVKYRVATCKEMGHDPCGDFHKLPAWERPTYDVDGQVVTEDEFINRLGEGVETIIHIRTRGL